MRLTPSIQAYKAELMTAPAAHVITAFGSVDKNFAIGATFPVFVCFLVNIVAVSFVLLHHALRAVLSETG
jgi:type III secretory pathway component EscV